MSTEYTQIRGDPWSSHQLRKELKIPSIKKKLMLLSNLKWASTLTLRTGSRSDFVILRLREGPQHVRTLVTVVLHNRQLRKDSRLMENRTLL